MSGVINKGDITVVRSRLQKIAVITTNSEIRPAMTHPNSLSESSPVLMVGEVTTPSLEVSDVMVSDSL